MKKLLLILLSVWTLCGCDLSWLHINESYKTSYITWYYVFDSFSGKYYAPNILSFTLKNSQQLGKKRDGYAALCAKHNDTAFNRYINDIYVDIEALAHDFESIKIVSDADFDVEHPAGVSLGDITTFVGYSFKPFIDAGYMKNNRPASTYDPALTSTEIRKKVEDLTVDDLTLLYPSCHMLEGAVFKILFDAEPTLSKTHNMTITLTTDDGKVFVSTVTAEFPKDPTTE